MRSLVARFQQFGLQQRIMFYVTGGLVVVLVAYSLVSLQAIRESTDLVFRERLTVARAVAQEIDGDLIHLQREVSEAADTIGPALAAGQVGQGQAGLDHIYMHWSLYDSFDNPCVITLTDVQGVALRQEPPSDSNCPADLSGLAAFQAVARSGQPYLGDSDVSAAGGQGRLWLALPVKSGDHLEGYIIANVGLDRISQRFLPMLELRKLGYDLELIASAGTTIASTRASETWAVSPHFQYIDALMANNQSGVAPDAGQPSANRPASVVAFAPLKALQWGVVVVELEDTALDLPRALQAQLILFGSLVLAVGLVLAWVTTRAVVKPINALIDATQRIASGQLDHPLDIAGADEVGRLARSFDDMRAELKQSREEIASWNRDLETRVERRTRELAALVAASQALTSTLDLDALFVILIQQVQAVLPEAEGILLFLFEPDEQRLICRSADGFREILDPPLRLQPGEAIAGKVFQAQRLVVLGGVAEVEAAQADLSDHNRDQLQSALGRQAVQSALGVPLSSKGVGLGALVVHNFSRPAAFREGDGIMLQALASQASAALENARLFAALQLKEAARTALLEKVIDAQEEERQRVAREIHDELGQLLTRLSINLKISEPDVPPQLHKSFDAMQSLVWQTMEQAHRLVVQLRPVLLDELGLEAALREELSQRLAPLGVDTDLSTEGALTRLPAPVEIAVFRIAQEAISNIARHAQARTARISLRRDGVALQVAIEDDGIGVPANWRSQANGRRPVGLLGMMERATLLGGTLSIEPNSPGGARLILRVPLDGHA